MACHLQPVVALTRHCTQTGITPATLIARDRPLFPSPATTTMAARVFRLDELASRIAAHLLVVSPRSTVALALTCKALEVPALRTLWGRQCTLSSLIERVMPVGAQVFFIPHDSDICTLASPLFSSSLHPPFSPVTNDHTGVAAAAHYAGAE